MRFTKNFYCAVTGNRCTAFIGTDTIGKMLCYITIDCLNLMLQCGNVFFLIDGNPFFGFCFNANSVNQGLSTSVSSFLF